MPKIMIDVKELDKLSIEFLAFPNECKRAMSSSLNRAVNKGSKSIAVEVKKEYAIRTQRGAKHGIDIKKATKNNLIAELGVTGKPILANEFVSKPQTFGGVGRMGNPLKLTIKKGQSALSAHMFTPYAKGNTVAKRYTGIYLHDGKGRFKPVHTVSIPQMVANDEVYKDISKAMERHYYEQFENTYPALIAKAQAKISGG